MVIEILVIMSVLIVFKITKSVISVISNHYLVPILSGDNSEKGHNSIGGCSEVCLSVAIERMNTVNEQVKLLFSLNLFSVEEGRRFHLEVSSRSLI